MAMIGHGQPINQATGFTTNAPTAFRTIVFACDPASYALSGVAAVVSHGHPLPIATGSYVWNIADLVTRDMGLTLSTATYAESGVAATLLLNRQLAATRGLYGLEGKLLTFHTPNHLFADPGSFSLSGTTTNLARNTRIAALSTAFVTLFVSGKPVILDTGSATLTALTGSYAISGSPSSRDFSLVMGKSNFVLTGINATLTKAGAQISALHGSYVWQLADAVTRDTGLACSTGSFALTGAPALLLFQSFNLVCSPGSFAISGSASQRDFSLALSPRAFALTASTTNLVKINTNFSLTCSPGSYVQTGIAANLARGRRLVAALGTYAETGITMVPHLNHRIAPALNAFAVSGVAARVVRFGRISIGIGTYAETGVLAVPRAGRKAVPVVGTYAIAGVSANFVRSRAIIATAGSYTETGVTALFRDAHKLITNVGSYLHVGNAIAFQTINNIALAPTLPGSFAITGSVSGLSAAHTMVAAPGSYAFNGVTAIPKPARALVLVSGTYALSAIAAAARAVHTFGPLAGIYTIGGTSTSQTGTHAITADFRAFAINGTDVNLPKTRSPMVAAPGAYAVAGSSATFAYGPGIAADHGVYAMAGGPIAFVHIVPPNMGAIVSPDTGLDIVGTITDPEIIGRPSDQLVA